jgi:glycosyltransferase involved in cell wall biosynthesis
MTPSKSLLALYPPGLRGELLEQILGEKKFPERYLFYGLDALIKCGVPVKSNLNIAPLSRMQQVISWIYKTLAKRWMGAHGNIEWLLPVWKELKRSPFIYVFSEKCLYPILVLRAFGVLPRVKTVLVSIGVSEKLQALKKRGLHRQSERLLKEFSLLTRIITFSSLEKEILTKEFSLENVSFIPLGVDTEYFRPGTAIQPIDVLGVGADRNRDFETFIHVALRLPELHFRLLTNDYHAKKLEVIGIPENVDMRLNVSMSDVADDMSKSKIVFLPVQENTYSGATTCLLQAMASERAVITNQVGPTSRGYGQVHDENVIFVPTGDVEKAVIQIKRLIKEDDIRREIGHKARVTVEEEFSLDRMIDLILSEIRTGYREAFGAAFPCEKNVTHDTSVAI